MLSDGGFVFGNGGVARVLAAEGPRTTAEAGDVVVVFGHLPCSHADCRACAIDERYTECEYGESAILGHGAGAPDGTYSQYVILPPHSYEIGFRAAVPPDQRTVRAMAYAFLAADVRNALTRDPATLRRDRVLLFGAGLSGRIAAYLQLQATPDAKIVVVDASEERAAQLQALQPDAIETYVPGPDVVAALNRRTSASQACEALQDTIGGIAAAMRRHFSGQRCNLLFDASSGNTAPLWNSAQVLSPGTECIAFGFGSTDIRLEQTVLQLSGLTVRTSRGVGTVANRRVVVALIEGEGWRFIERYLLGGTIRLDGLDEAIAFIRAQQVPPKMLHEIPPAYLSFESV
jgi:threonine dehydrogenase-like Zn-dependent dehydrogenase